MSATKPDLISLATARMPELLGALEIEIETTEPEQTEPEQPRRRMPSRRLQIAKLMVAETVRLIRVGGRTELAEATVAMTRLLARQPGRQLAKQHQEAHRLVTGAAVVLTAANSPSSSAGELAVLRSWNGKAREAVALLNSASGYELPRARLRALLGIADESRMSHILADLEAAGLAVRRREGREVMVYLGPTGHTDRVQEQLPDLGWESLEWRGRQKEDRLVLDATMPFWSREIRHRDLDVSNIFVSGDTHVFMTTHAFDPFDTVPPPVLVKQS